jgi:hypothetical protein
MDCANARVFLCPELDHELSVHDSALLQDHLHFCSKCSQEWEALFLVHQSVSALKAGIVIPDKLEDRVMEAINREDRKGNVRRLPLARVFSAATLAAIACVCLLMLLPSWYGRDSVESLVNETAHGIESSSQKNFRRVIGFDSGEMSAATQYVGLSQEIAPLAHLNVVSLDVYQGKNNGKILRACYQDRHNHSFCIDCYQANSGLLSFNGTEITTKTGRKVLVAQVGNLNVVMLSQGGVDYVYTSMLPKDLLLAMVVQPG